MKRYRLKEEVKKYFQSNMNVDAVQELGWWQDWDLSLEALEEVPQRVELLILNDYDLVKSGKYTRDKPFTDQEKDLCEAILNAPKHIKEAILNNGELLDIDSLDDVTFNNLIIDGHAISVKRLKEVLKQYLKESNNYTYLKNESK